MLILSRRPGEAVFIECPDGTVISVSVTMVDRNKVRLGFSAPDNVNIRRSELPPGPMALDGPREVQS